MITENWQMPDTCSIPTTDGKPCCWRDKAKQYNDPNIQTNVPRSEVFERIRAAFTGE